ncbi:acid protease [Stereum hirsutum FP-91666 SS1]|uniref:acid protease n=1 Tax=Stereum hirsutum (strain FP-91666) TaxID=721885 RepID=UPI00044495F4|nr:acid protease [Stereum hirsutum FP-91666 SS1]EIM84930.1 acid protease [Stereum hirsutum FP-91666 SS1]
MHSSSLARTVVTTLGCTVSVANAAGTLKASFSSHLVPHSGNAPSTNTYGLFSANSTADAPTDNAVLKVVTTVQAGNNQTFSQVLVDTGSAILWVGGEDPYEVGPNTVSINKTFSVGYGAGGVNGTAYNDTVTIGDATVTSQIIGAAGYLTGFTLVSPIDGILGLGPPGSNAGEVLGFNGSSTPTFVENLLSQGAIDEPVFGIYVNSLNTSEGSGPINATEGSGSGSGAQEMGRGEIVFGGWDEGRVDGPLTWVPQNEPYNFHWEFNVSSFDVGNTTLVNETTPARTDTGVLSIGLPIDAILSIVSSTNATYVSSNQSTTFLGYLAFPPAPSNITDDSDLPSFTFYLGSSSSSSASSSSSSSSLNSDVDIDVSVDEGGDRGEAFIIPPSQYLIPPSLYPSLNLTTTSATGAQEGGAGIRYSWVTSAGFGAFSLGQKWLEGVYTVYDMGGRRVGFGHLV